MPARTPFDFRSAFQRALPYGGFLEHYGTDEQRRRWEAVYHAAVLSDAQKELLGAFRRTMHVLCLAGPWCDDCAAAGPILHRFAEACHRIDLRFINRQQDFDPAGGDAARPGTAGDPDDIRSRPIGKILVKWGILTPERVDKALLAQEERKARGLNVRIGDVMTELGMISAQQRDEALAAQGGYGSFASWDTALANELSICGGSRVPMLVFLSEDWYECERFGERTLATYRQKARKAFADIPGAACPASLAVPERDLLAANIAEWLRRFERVQWMLLTSPRLSRLHGESH